MTIASQISDAQRAIDKHNKSVEVAAVCKYLMLEDFSFFRALKRAEEARALPRVKEILQKAAVEPVGTGSTVGGVGYTPWSTISDGFLSTMYQELAFDEMLPSMRQFPLHVAIVATTKAPTAAVLSEAQFKPVSDMTFISGQLTERKAVAGPIVVSKELLQHSGVDVLRYLELELRQALALATDIEFLSVLTSGVTAIPSSGTNANAVRADLRALLAAVNVDKRSKLFLLVQPSTAEQLSIMGDSAGNGAFPQLTPAGGTIGGIRVVTSDAVQTGQLVLVDAHQIAAGQEGFEIKSSGEASLHMNTTPDSPPNANTALLSLWTYNLVGMMAERYVGFLRLRSTAVATISGASYLGNSPA